MDAPRTPYPPSFSKELGQDVFCYLCIDRTSGGFLRDHNCRHDYCFAIGILAWIEIGVIRPEELVPVKPDTTIFGKLGYQDRDHEQHIDQSRRIIDAVRKHVFQRSRLAALQRKLEEHLPRPPPEADLERRQRLTMDWVEEKLRLIQPGISLNELLEQDTSDSEAQVLAPSKNQGMASILLWSPYHIQVKVKLTAHVSNPQIRGASFFPKELLAQYADPEDMPVPKPDPYVFKVPCTTEYTIEVSTVTPEPSASKPAQRENTEQPVDISTSTLESEFRKPAKADAPSGLPKKPQNENLTFKDGAGNLIQRKIALPQMLFRKADAKAVTKVDTKKGVYVFTAGYSWAVPSSSSLPDGMDGWQTNDEDRVGLLRLFNGADTSDAGKKEHGSEDEDSDRTLEWHDVEEGYGAWIKASCL